MSRIALVAAVGATLCGWSAAVSAAPASVAGVYEAGRCMVARDRRAATALIRALPLDGPADLSALGRSGARVCLGGAEGASALLVRGAIAQALFLRDFRSFGREPSEDIRLVDLALPVESSPSGSRTVELYRWGDCVVRNDAAGTERLLNTAVGSADESAAIAALQPYMSACMRAGSELTVRASEVRSLFAQGAYHTMYRYTTGQLAAARPGRGN